VYRKITVRDFKYVDIAYAHRLVGYGACALAENAPSVVSYRRCYVWPINHEWIRVGSSNLVEGLNRWTDMHDNWPRTKGGQTSRSIFLDGRAI